MIKGIGQSIINGTYELETPRAKGVACPHCESVAQVKVYDYDVYVDEEEVRVNRQYLCRGCGHLFNTDRYYNVVGYEIVREEEDE